MDEEYAIVCDPRMGWAVYVRRLGVAARNISGSFATMEEALRAATIQTGQPLALRLMAPGSGSLSGWCV